MIYNLVIYNSVNCRSISTRSTFPWSSYRPTLPITRLHYVFVQQISANVSYSGIYFYIYCANYCSTSWYKNCTIIRTINVKVNPRRRHVSRNLLYKSPLFVCIKDEGWRKKCHETDYKWDFFFSETTRGYTHQKCQKTCKK